MITVTSTPPTSLSTSSAVQQDERSESGLRTVNVPLRGALKCARTLKAPSPAQPASRPRVPENEAAVEASLPPRGGRGPKTPSSAGPQRVPAPPASGGTANLPSPARFKVLTPWIPPGTNADPLRKIGVPVLEKVGYNANPHALSRAVANYAYELAVEKLLGMGPTSILSLFTSMREVRVLARTGLPHTWTRPVVVAEDMLRSVADPPTIANGDAPAYTLQDVYQAPNTSLFEFLTHSPCTMGVVVNKKFRGLFGEYLGEGAWHQYQAQQWMVNMKSSVNDHVMTHPACHWLHRPGSANHWAWTPYKILGMEEITAFRQADPLVAQPPQDVPEGVELARVVRSNKLWIMWFYQMLPPIVQRLLESQWCENVWVDSQFMNVLRAARDRRNLTGWTFATLQARAAEYMRTFPVFCASFPDQVQPLIDIHVRAAWMESFAERAASMRSVQVFGSYHAHDINSNREALAEPVATNSKWLSVLAMALTGAAVAAAPRLVGSMVARVASWAARYAVNALSSVVVTLFSQARIALSRPPIQSPRNVNLYIARFPVIASVEELTQAFDDAGNGFTKSIAPRFVAWAPLVEEVVKCTSVGKALTLLADANSFGAVCMHGVSWFLPFPARLLFHFSYNLVVTLAKPTPLTPWGRWSHHVYQPQLKHAWQLNDTIAATSFTAETCWTPPVVKCHVEERKALCPLLTVKVDEELKTDYRCAAEFTCNVFPTNVPLYKGSNNGNIAYTCIRERILAAHPNIEGQRNVYHQGTSRWVLELVDQCELCPRSPELDENWLAHFDPSRQKFYRAQYLAYLKRGPYWEDDRDVSVTKVMPKLNEHLVRPSCEFKPRSIANVHPFYQCHCAGVIRAVTRRLHEQWNFEHAPRKIGGWDFYPIFASGLTDQEIGGFVNFAYGLSNAVVVMVAGDDSIVAIVREGVVTWIETDFSAYDQTQAEPPLEFEFALMHRLGVEPDITGVLRRMSKLPYVYQNKKTQARMRVHRDKRAMRDTGGPNTTFGNSVVNISAWCYHVERNFDDASFRDMGFKIKKREVTLETMSFLKGFWYRTAHGFTWAPSPSRFLKMGKIINDPRTTYKEKDLCKAISRHFAGLAATYKQYSQVPLISAFVRRFYVEGVESAHRQIEYMVRGTETPLLDPIGDTVAHFEGAVTREFLLMAEKWISVLPYFTFLEHPGFEVLALRDYN